MSFYKFSICTGDQSDHHREKNFCPVLNIFFNVINKKKICYHEINLPPQSITITKGIPEMSWRMKKIHTFGLRSLRTWLELKCKYIHNEQIENNIKMTALLRFILLLKFLNSIAKNSICQKKKKEIQKSICKTKHTKISTSTMLSFQRRTLNI